MHVFKSDINGTSSWPGSDHLIFKRIYNSSSSEEIMSRRQEVTEFERIKKSKTLIGKNNKNTGIQKTVNND